MRYIKYFFKLILFVLMVLPYRANAVDSDLEELYDRLEDKGEISEKSYRADKKKRKSPRISKITTLGELAPFEDVAVIQRIFLPKTKRFEFSLSGVGSLNNAFFNNVGGGVRFSYYLTEKYALEGVYFSLSDSERDVTESLKKNQRVKTESLVIPSSYMGVNFKWVPLYGKIALMDHRIIPFDLYFVGGIGTTETGNNSSETTISVGTGQLFAINKAWAFRWDFNWNFYDATVIDNGNKSKKGSNDLFISFGASFFFPEAGYR